MKANCGVCGKEFEKKGSAAYCSQECRREGHRRKALEWRLRANQAAKENPAPDWKAIGKLMEETGKTYGKLVAEGRI